MQVTSIEQSKRLIELGLDTKTADMCYGWAVIGEKYLDYAKHQPPYDDELPAWSLSRLLELMPISYQMTRDRGKVQLMLITVLRRDYYDNELEAAYSMIRWLLENNLFDAEKLKNYVPPKQCCLCGRRIYGHGHNAAPVADGVCCNECNETKVVPERLRILKDLKK